MCLVHCACLVPDVTVWFSTQATEFLNPLLFALILEGKKKSVKTSEASADLSDFLPKIVGISVPFARENLHLVILFLVE